MNPAELSRHQQRSLLLELRFRIDNRNIGELCAKYGMTRTAFQRLRKELGHQAAGEEELVIAGVYEGARTLDSLIGYLDYRNHARYPEAEVRAFVDNLVSIGVLVEGEAGWSFAPGAPAAGNRFVFTAPDGTAAEPIDFGRVRHPSLR